MNQKHERINISGLYNARDLGGMPTKDGKITCFHHLIRSDALDTLPDDAIDALSDYPVKVIIDLRSVEEASTHPDRVKDDPRFRYYNIPLLRVNADDIGATAIQDTIRTSLGHLYVWLFENSKPYFAEVLRTILKEAPNPVLFHCAHGKDRTGLIAAIFYLLANVDRKDIVSNYAVSYEFVKDLVAPLIASTPDHVHHIYRSDAPNMERLLSHVDSNYQGDIRIFLKSTGLSDEEIEGLTALILEK